MMATAMPMIIQIQVHDEYARLACQEKITPLQQCTSNMLLRMPLADEYKQLPPLQTAPHARPVGTQGM